MKAKEARELTNERKKTIDDVVFSIKAMAGDGYDYTCIEKRKIADIERIKQFAKENGYKLEESDNHITLKW